MADWRKSRDNGEFAQYEITGSSGARRNYKT